MKSFGSYNITHTTDGDESYSIPISGTIKDFPAFIDLQNSIKEDGYFIMNETFSVSDDPDPDVHKICPVIRIQVFISFLHKLQQTKQLLKQETLLINQPITAMLKIKGGKNNEEK